MDPLSLPDQPHGPYHQPPTEAFIGFAQRRTLLLAALGGVELGAWDARILDWLAHFCDTPTFLAVLGLLERARRAGAELARGQADQAPAEAARLSVGGRRGGLTG
jgi:hypothetical protein